MIAKFVREIAKTIGVKTVYHICAIAPTETGEMTTSLNLTVQPWIHVDNYMDAVETVSQKMPEAKTRPCITSITKLGI